MLPFAEIAVAVLLSAGATGRAAPAALDSIPVLPAIVMMRPLTLGWAAETPQDTVRRRRKAYEYSSGYTLRNTIHRRLSYAMLPLFAMSYFSGDQILEKGKDAPSWARSMHRPAATGSAFLFGANTITGGWNLIEGRRDPNGRTKRILHSVLFMGASAGFVYSGTKLANEAEQSSEKRRQHRDVNLVSMGVSTASWLLMLVHR